MTSSFSPQSEPARYYYGLYPQYQEEYEHLQSMNYNIEVQRPKLKTTDQLNFQINVISRSVDSNSVSRLNTLLHNHQEVSCKRFFQEGQDWIKSILFHQDFPSESIEELAQRLVPEVHELFDFNEKLFGSDFANGAEPSDNLRFTLSLKVVVMI
ncbi:hypothetical protein L195_g047817 [Trifolium pratense]|uniref:Uncharacterized protein n=1 Tax=Trifolium pratense TaxID=57577 RepID=A0A2K3MLP7_TRIPR|nr:hypothetical protein L195_g047817 [Trifolium pratense]